ncbi:hypothetical protein HanPSC8_Chr16g0715621 [Helianthus annuus]|nr:hypothetical protein HanPSC8_Chr16g0715621 [Helianthus annuus]
MNEYINCQLRRRVFLTLYINRVQMEDCSKSFAPFPTGYLDHTGGELMNFEHPKNKMKAITRVDSEGAVCGAAFKVDLFAKTKSMPRVGSHANWAWSQDA